MAGIVRKIDELGRIVIPKEMRKQLGIEARDEVEIGLDDSGEIVVRKWDRSSRIEEAVALLLSAAGSGRAVEREQLRRGLAGIRKKLGKGGARDVG